MTDQETREAFQHYLDEARHRNETSREREIHKELNDLSTEMRARFLVQAQPLIDELIEINSSKPPLPVMGDDGKIYTYHGPRFWEEDVDEQA